MDKPAGQATRDVPAGRRLSLAHGNGGRLTRELVETVFARHLKNPLLDISADAVFVELAGTAIAVTTDGFTVDPLVFPGGDLGSLAVNGTVNDLAVAGALPQHLSLNAFIEEGFDRALLERLMESAGNAARAARVTVVAGDTKVVPRGEGGGLYLATTGIGLRDPNAPQGLAAIREGDGLLVSGPIGDHGTAIMLAREDFGLSGDLHSDCASVLPLARAAMEIKGLRFMRDPTRGGLATVAHEIAEATGLSVRLRERDVPVREPVHGVCEALGYDPYYLACEGRIVAVADQAAAEAIAGRWRSLPGGEDAAIIGVIENGTAPVVLQTALGGERVIEELEDDPLPRIC